MKKLWLGLAVSVATLVAPIGNSWAQDGPEWHGHNGYKPPKAEKPPKVKPIRAPEIDVGAAGGAIALLVGGLLLVAEKRRRAS